MQNTLRSQRLLQSRKHWKFFALKINTNRDLSVSKPNTPSIPMTKNLATEAKQKTAKTYLIMAAAFIVIFGGITLLGIFIAHFG
jgi:hypothetical protein